MLPINGLPHPSFAAETSDDLVVHPVLSVDGSPHLDRQADREALLIGLRKAKPNRNGSWMCGPVVAGFSVHRWCGITGQVRLRGHFCKLGHSERRTAPNARSIENDWVFWVGMVITYSTLAVVLVIF